MGDFFEMFGEDPIIGSKELEITLTSRERGKKERIPLCGVPWHALDSYLPKLVSKGYKVATAEQLEDPRTAKGLVERDVVRIVTPGTVLESTVLESKANNYLMAIAEGEDAFGLSVVDISTGEFVVTEVGGEDADLKVLAEFAQRAPKEVLHARAFNNRKLMDEFSYSGAAMTPLDDLAFLREASESLIRRHFKVQTLDGFGFADRPLAIGSAGAILRYLETTQKRELGFLSPPRFSSVSDKLVLDQTTLRNLEVMRNVRDGGTENTLSSILDRTHTPMGARMLKKWLTEPLMDRDTINGRLDAVEELVSKTVARSDIGGALRQVRDLERLIARVVYGSANGRDIISIRSCLDALPELKAAPEDLSSRLLAVLSAELHDTSALAAMMGRALVDDPPVSLKEGGLVRDGFDAALDDLRRSFREGGSWIAGLEESERKRTGRM